MRGETGTRPMNTTASEFSKSVVFEVNGWAIINEIGLYRSRFGIAVMTRDQDGEVLYGYYNEPLSYLLARFDPALLSELELALAKDIPRDGEARDPECEVRADRLAYLRLNETTHLYTPMAYPDGEKVFDSYNAILGTWSRAPRI